MRRGSGDVVSVVVPEGLAVGVKRGRPAPRSLERLRQSVRVNRALHAGRRVHRVVRPLEGQPCEVRSAGRQALQIVYRLRRDPMLVVLIVVQLEPETLTVPVPYVGFRPPLSQPLEVGLVPSKPPLLHQVSVLEPLHVIGRKVVQLSKTRRAVTEGVHPVRKAFQPIAGREHR